jgi:hypothetical protein
MLAITIVAFAPFGPLAPTRIVFTEPGLIAVPTENFRT